MDTTKIINYIKEDGIKVIISILLFFIIYKIINMFTNKVTNRLKKRKKPLDESIIQIVTSIINKGLKVLVLLILLQYIGIKTTSIVTFITSIFLSIGLALQGSLSNLAGGFLILVTKPFKLHDYIETNEVSGNVESISMFYTHITTIDNKVITIPNGVLSNSLITNYSKNKLRRLDMTFNIDLENDLNLIKSILKESVIDSKLNETEPFININAFKSSYVELILKVWCKQENYWDLYYYLLESINNKLNSKKCIRSFNRLNVIIKN